MICANKNNPLFQELSKNVPSGFITKLLTENPEIKPEEIYNKYIAKLQQLDKGQVELPNVIPLKGNEQLYKDYNLLAKDGKVKVIKEKEASSWLEKLNRSPYYSFAYRKTGLKEGRIFILPKQEPVEKTKPGKPEQLTLFAPSEVNYGLKSVEILSSDKAKQIFSKGEKSGWDLNKILTELQIPKPQKEIIIGLGKTKLDDIITDLLANYSYTIEINTAKIKDISQFNQQYNEHTRVFEYNGFEYKADDYYAEESGIVYEKAPLNNLNNTVSITEQEFNQAANNAGFNKTQDIPTQYYSNLTVPGGTNYTENEIATPAITPSIKGHAQFATDKGIGWFRSDEQVLGGKYYPGGVFEGEMISSSTEGGTPTKTRRILEVQSDLFQKGRDKKIITKNYLEDRIEYDSNKSKYYYFTVLEGEKVVTTKYFNTQKEAAESLIKDEQEGINVSQNQNQFLQLLNKDNNWVTFFVKSIIQDSAKKGYEKVLFPSGNTASKVEGHTTLEEFKKEKEDRIKKLEENKKTYDERNPNATKEHRQNKIDFYDREINQLKQELARVEKEGFGALKPIYNFYENTVTNVLRKQGYNPVLITDEYGNTWNEVTIKPEYLNKILFSKITGAGNKFSNYIPGKKSDSQTVLKQIAQTGGALAAIAKQLLKSGLNIPIEIIDVDSFNKDNLPEGVEGFDKSLDDNFQAAGLWSPTERKIFLAKGANVQNTADILMHEILHGYTNLYIYNNPNSASVKNLDRLLKHLQTEKVQQMLTDKYPLTNLDELLVGIFTNPTFINDLKKLPPTNKNFKSVWEEILQIFRVIFGVTNTSLFDEIFAASSVIVDESMEQMIEQEEFVDTTYIKPGVEELFESNPELANQVYEALGLTAKEKYEKIENLTYDNFLKLGKEEIEGILKYNLDIYPSSKPSVGIPLLLGGSYKTIPSNLFKELQGDRIFIKYENGQFNLYKQRDKGKQVKPDTKLSRQEEDKILSEEFLTYSSFNRNWIIYKEDLSGNEVTQLIEYSGKLEKETYSEEDYKKAFNYWSNQQKQRIEKPKITVKQKQQAQQLYSQYLDTIFPDSKVKDIVYHTTNVKFDKFKVGNVGYLGKGIYFFWDNIGKDVYNISAIINTINPEIIDDYLEQKNIQKDSILHPDELVVFEPEQIYILGNKQDIEGFKKFVGKQNKVLAAPISNVQKIVSDRLDSLQTKVIRNPQDNSVVIKDLENIQWIRPSEVAKSKIQKRQFGLKTVEQEEFEKLAQEAGTILHNIQANIIKETFPEYNKHVQKMVIDEGMLGFEQAIRKQLQPIINEAKSRGSILKAEVWIGNLKSQKGGTADLLEITPEGNYYVYDLKTRFTQDVSPLRRFNKINEWSDQTLEYNEILKAGDSELGVVQGKVLGTYILELEVEVKPENKFNYSGSTKYKATNAEKFLKRRELKNIKIVAPTFFLTGDKKIDAMINKLRSQIENMAKKTVSQEQRPAFNQTFESKLDLLQALQLKKDYNKFIQSGYIELAIIRKKLESNDLTDSAFIKEQLELYTNALGLLNPPQEVREQFKKIQGEAQELEIMFEELRKETVVDSANETDVIKRVGFADNLFAAVKDVSWVFSQTMGLADVDNPIVQTVFRKTTVALEKAREKVQQLGDRLMEVSNAYIKATGDKTYSKLIENGHLVDQWKPDFWKEFNAAKNQKNFDWAKDNVTFDEKSYIEARDKQLDFHDSITRDVYANKLKLENPDLDQNEIKRLVEAEIAAQMKKWEASYKNAFTYFTPKTKWTNPKYTEIINGPQEVKEMYLTLKNLLEYANEIIPERVKKNFIPNFQRDYIDKATQLGLLGSIKASWSGFFDSVEVTYDDEMMSQKDAITGEKLGRMWIPGITEIENKSLDLPVVFFKFMEGVYRYEELKSLEDLALTAKDILKKQQWLATDMLGNAISVDKTPSRPNPASRTLAMMEGWVDQVFYNKSLQKDVAVEIKGNGFTELIGILKKGDKKMLSIGKMVDKVIHWTTLKNLGFSLYSPMVNLLGGSANMYMTGANGLYYSKSDLNKAMALALAGKTNLPNEDAKKARLILDWLNINAGEFIKKQEDLLSNSITKKLMADYNALALMRESENVLRDAGALAVVLGGKYEFNWDSFKVVDGKLVVEANDFQKSKFKQQIIKINRKNIGGISEDDMMLAKQQIVGRMLMQHRSWLPALFYERFGGKKYDWVLDKDIEGRYVTAFRLFKHLIGLSKITQLSEMEQANLKSTRIELALIIGIGILRSLLKSGLDDEDKKEAWYKISDKISDRVTGELVFFVDPTFESQYQILLSPAPVLGTAGDVGKFIGSLYKADDEDKRTKGPLQRAIKLTPLSKVDAFLTDLGLNPIDEK